MKNLEKGKSEEKNVVENNEKKIKERKNSKREKN